MVISKNVRFFACIILSGLWLLAAPILTLAQKPSEWQPITAANASRLQPVGFLSPGAVDDVVWSPDGGQLAVVNRFRGIRLLDATDLRPFLFIPNFDPAGMVEQVAFSPDGRQLAFRVGNGLSGTRQDFDIHLWDLWTHEPIAVLPGYLIAFSPDGRWLATAADETTLHIWSATTGEKIAALDHHADWIRTIAFSPDHQLMVSVDLAGIAQLWDTQTFQVIATLEGTPDDSPDLQFSASGDFLVINTNSDLVADDTSDQSNRSRLTIWDIRIPSQPVPYFEYQDDTVNSFLLSPDEQQLVFSQNTRSSTGFPQEDRIVWLSSIRVLDLTTGNTQQFPGTNLLRYTQPGVFNERSELIFTFNDVMLAWDGTNIRQIPVPLGPFRFPVLSPQADRVAVVDGLRNIRATWFRIYDATTGEILTEMPSKFTWGFLEVQMQPGNIDGPQLIVTGGTERELNFWYWDQANLILVDSFARSLAGEADQIAFSGNGRFLATTENAYPSCKGRWALWVFNPEPFVTSYMGDQRCMTPHPTALTFHPDNRTVAVGYRDGTIRVWDAESLINKLEVHVDTGSEMAVLAEHTAPVIGIDYSPDGMWLASVDADGVVILRHATTLEEIQRFTGTGKVAFSPDSRLLAAGTKVFDISTGQEVLEVAEGPAYDLTFSPDSSLLFTADDFRVRGWEVSTGHELFSMAGNLGLAGGIGLTFSTDGRFLIIAGSDGVTRLWGVPLP